MAEYTIPPQSIHAMMQNLHQQENTSEAKTSKYFDTDTPPTPPTPPTKKGARWTDPEIQQLLDALAADTPIAAIATTHDRTRGAIESRQREVAADMIERGVAADEVATSVRLTAAQVAEAVEKRVAQNEAQKGRKAKKESEKQATVNASVAPSSWKKQKLSVEQRCALQQFEDDDNLFITGEGGTGKTLLIRHLVHAAKNVHGKKVQVCALTGCAALLLECNARTIHSWSGIRLGRGELDEIVENVIRNHKARTAWRTTDVLIVDEVSMMSCHIFEVLDSVGKRVRGSRKPFGGMQVVFVGDFFQLPPVAKNSDTDSADGKFCFESVRWNHTFPPDNHIVLTTMFRQNDATFRRILGHVRDGKIDDADIAELKECVGRTFDADAHQGVVPTKLYPTKHKVDTVNAKMFNALEGDPVQFKVELKSDCAVAMDGSERPLPGTVLSRCKKLLTKQKIVYEQESLVNNSPCSQSSLLLKRGANVMCTVNLDLSRGICNGSLGTVADFTADGKPVVRFANGVITTIPIKYWQSEDFPTIAIGQYPLCLAWAMTIHKIQGATLTMAEIDVGSDIFECGQTYVALSRVRDLSGLYLAKFDPKRVKTSARVRAFYDSIPEVEYEVEVEEENENENDGGVEVEGGELTFDRFAMDSTV